MTKVKGPLFSIGASKSIGKEITFRKGRRKSHAQKYFTPKVRYTEDQVKVRQTFDDLQMLWEVMPDAYKEAWNEYAKLGLRGRISGSNAFMKYNFTKYFKTDELDDLPNYNFNVILTSGKVLTLTNGEKLQIHTGD